VVSLAFQPTCGGACSESLESQDDEAGLHLLQRAVKKANASRDELMHVADEDPKKKEKPLTASSIMHVTVNSAGDLEAFESALIWNSLMTIVCLLLFLVLRRHFPSMFAHNAQIYDKLKTGTLQLSDSLWSPLSVSWKLTVDDIDELVGLDQAMLIEFSNLTMRMMLVIGIPQWLVLVPFYAFDGGNPAGADSLSHIGLSNVERNHWMYWLVALFVWYVVIVVQLLIFRTHMKDFLPRRKRWLMSMPLPRSNTVLVQNIPVAFRSHAELAGFFTRIFGEGSVTHCCIVKDTSDLRQAIDDKVSCSQELHEREIAWDKAGEADEEQRASLQARLQAAEAKVEKLREDTIASEKGLSSSAFVTFKDQQQSIMALSMKYTEDDQEFVILIPPDPADVRYRDLEVDQRAETIRNIIGYGLISALFFGFVPLIGFTTNITTLQSLETVPALKVFFDAHPKIAATWDGIAGSFALTVFMSFLPTFLVFIFSEFFSLRAEAWLQHEVQKWYFYFLMIFVLLVTAVGGSLFDQTKFLIDHPTEIFRVLAATLPMTTHFYLNYVPMQWGLHGMNLTRYINFIKYLGLREICTPERARELAEPEDQDYYGMGSRSARHTLICIIGVVLSTLSPLIALLVFVSAFLIRGFYAYLIVYAETRKSDLGGVFWCTKMVHLQQGLLVYIILMTGVLLQRAGNMGPGIFAGSSAVIWCWRYYRFRHKFNVESLPLKDLSGIANSRIKMREATRATYDQPELQPPKAAAVDDLQG